MDTFRIDYDELDVDAIMAQIRQRVREKKGVVYTDDELERLGGLKLASPKPPEEGDQGEAMRSPAEELDLPEPMTDYAERIMSLLKFRIKRTMASQVVERDFLKEVLDHTFDTLEEEEQLEEEFGDDWNLNITLNDLYRSSPGVKGKIIEAFRSLNRRLFKLTMNIDVLFPQFHRQNLINQLQRRINTRQRFANDTFVRLFHALIEELSTLYNQIAALRDDNVDNFENLLAAQQTFSNEMINRKQDIVHHQGTLEEQTEAIRQLQYKVDNYRGLIEGQRQQIEYLLARQRALEKLAVLKEEPKEPGAKRKSSELEPGRYSKSKGEGDKK